MRIAIVYHFPLDLHDEYLPYVRRFSESYLRFKPETKVELFLATSGAEKVEERHTARVHWGYLPYIMGHTYTGKGMDIGSYLDIAPIISGHDFALFCGATTYFHRVGWLERLIEARENYGEGLYATSASFEGSPLGTHPAPNPHIRTSCFACNPKDLARYPKKINSREDCYRFENGEWRISRHIQPVRVVYWNECVTLRDCRSYSNVFRRGDQSNLLAWDRRTEEYATANAQEKTRLERLADGDIAHFPI